jgi:ribonucleoside-triphosphate reductase
LKNMTEYQKFIAMSRYARWLPKEQRRESWDETVQRYISFFQARDYDSSVPWEKIQSSIQNMEVMPSMRCMMTAGKALERDNVAGFNCAFTNIDDPKVFSEILYILCCGTGVGFGVSRETVKKMPEIAEEFYDTDTTIIVADSKLGWANSLKELISMLYSGRVPKFDLSKVRPAGEPLKTFGGRASGPEPLKQLFEFTIATFKDHAGRKLTTVACHDLVCKIAEVVVCGGVRRSACISLSSLTDDRMAKAKSGQWWIENPQRALANNSVSYTEPPEVFSFMKEWLRMYESKSGERGMFNLQAARKHASSNGRRDGDQIEGTNPCAEILLRSKQFCNLSEVVIRKGDSLKSLKEKIEIATIIGTMQATLTDFRYLSKKWKMNTEEEALLGVSLTGIMDHPVMNGSEGHNKTKNWLNQLRTAAIEANAKWAPIFGVNQSTAITAVKPSGTVSALVDSASGIHSRHSDFYIRTVRADIKDPLCQLMIDCNVPHEPCVINTTTVEVFSFPMKSPTGCVTRNDRTAIEQLELWKIYQTEYCEHKPSVTISVKEEEYPAVGGWVWDNFDLISGVSFLPYSDHTYQQAPFQDCTEQEYKDLKAQMPKIDWDRLVEYEVKDETIGSQTLACAGGICEITDLVK